MKTFFILAVMLLALLSSCGGGGGGSKEMRCERYCMFTCAKSANCGFFPSDSANLDVCSNACISGPNGDLNIYDIRSAENCEQTQREVEAKNCSELAVMLGFARSREKTFMTPVDVGLNCQFVY